MDAMSLRVDAEFSALCPALTNEERNLLEASLERDGCMDPIITWANHDDTILDGHNRYSICTRFEIPFKTKALTFKTREEAIEWIITNQLARRNLSEEQKSYLRGKRYQSEKKAEGAPVGNKNAAKQLAHNGPVVTTANKLAAEFKVSKNTIKRDAEFAEAVDTIAETAGPEVKTEILSGKSPLTKKDVVAIAELPPTKQKAAIESKSNGKSPSEKAGRSKEAGVKTDVDKLIERIEQLIAQVDRMAIANLGHNDQSRSVVKSFRECISKVKAMSRSWRNK